MGRAYGIDGVELPSVTTIIDVLDKPALKQWAANQAIEFVKREYLTPRTGETRSLHDILDQAKTAWRSVSQEALDVGSAIHNMIEDHVRLGAAEHAREMQNRDFPEQVKNGFTAFLEWEKENIDKWIKSEHTVYNMDYGFAGTLDAVARLNDGKVYVVDFKSSKGFYDGYDLQLAAYRLAFEGMMTDEDDYNIEGMGILRLDKETGVPEWKEYRDYTRKRQAFLALLEFYYKVKKRRLKGNRHVV
jgi:hypothetical protein